MSIKDNEKQTLKIYEENYPATEHHRVQTI